MIGSTIDIFERPFKLVGIYEPPGGGRIKIPLATMQDQVGSENRCNTILVACADPAQQEQVASCIKAPFPRRSGRPDARPGPELYMSSVPALNIFLKVVVGVATTISMLVILLAMYTTVTERTRQIGILKSPRRVEALHRLGHRAGSDSCQRPGRLYRRAPDPANPLFRVMRSTTLVV